MKEDVEISSQLVATLGATIMAKRKEKGLSQTEFADFLGIEQHSLSRMEKGKIAPKLSRLQQIASGLGCSVADLFKVSPKEVIGTKGTHVDAKAKAEVIAEMLDTLSPELQDVVIELVEKTVSVLGKK